MRLHSVAVVPARCRRLGRGTAVESTPSLTGAMADHRLPLESARIGQFACQLGRRLGLPIAATGDTDPQYARWLDALVEGLRAQHGSALIVIGAAQPPWMHALGHVLNAALASDGTTISYTEPVEKLPGEAGTLASLVAMRAGAVDTLLILDSSGWQC